METTEKIVEAYVRYVKGWATIPNIKCPGQLEIDLLAIDPRKHTRYHIESGVSVSGSYSKLTNQPFNPHLLKKRSDMAAQRRTLGYFVQKKFSSIEVIQTLREYGFKRGNYKKVIVTWGWKGEAKLNADKLGIELWDFRQLIAEIASTIEPNKTYFTDDTLRTLHLYVKAMPAKRLSED